MMPAPTTVHEAELRVRRSVDEVRAGFGRMRAAGRAALPERSTLIIAAGVSGLALFWLARRPRLRPAASVNNLGQAATTSTLGLVMAFVFRYGLPHLAKVLR
jgi:hypothetical protein